MHKNYPHHTFVIELNLNSKAVYDLLSFFSNTAQVPHYTYTALAFAAACCQTKKQMIKQINGYRILRCDI